jgi:HAD superfamily hydrolase (TIGR01509 family)
MKDIKLVIFDLDGVLIDSREIHFRALNFALREAGVDFQINELEHLNTFEGLPTKVKLKMLQNKGKIREDQIPDIIIYKNKHAALLLKEIIPDPQLLNVMQFLKSKDLFLAIATNSIRSTLDNAIDALKIQDYIDFRISNQDVDKGKPYPYMYWRCIEHFGLIPSDTIIVEDSPIGRIAAKESGTHTIFVSGPEDIKIELFNQAIFERNRKGEVMNWTRPNLQILIPMAGEGSRFKSAGFTFPKPLIEINGNPMISEVVESLQVSGKFIFICKEEHIENFSLKYLFTNMVEEFVIVNAAKLTEGAAVTALLARELIDNDNPLIIANSDQFIRWDSVSEMHKVTIKDADGAILVFKATHPKWSFVKINDEGFITEVAEKRPISDTATVGVYYWRRGRDFVKFADQMISKNIRTNGEFYIAPVYNEAINYGMKILPVFVDEMWGLGTPEDLNDFKSGRP